MPLELPAPFPRCSDHVAFVRSRWPGIRPFWRRALEGAPGGFALAPGRRAAGRLSARSHPFHLSTEAAGRVSRVTRNHAATPYVVVVAAWSRALRRWTGQEDLVLMSPVAGRDRPELEVLVGCLVESLLLRVDASGDPPFHELLARVRDSVLAAVEHQRCPYEELSREVRWPAWVRYERRIEPAHFPSLESGPFDLPLELMLEWPLREGEIDQGVPELRLIAQPDGSIGCWLIHNRHAFDRPVVERLADAFVAEIMSL